MTPPDDLERAHRALRTTEQAAERLRALLELSVALSPAHTTRDVATLAVDRGRAILGASSAALGIVSGDGEQLHVVERRGVREPAREGATTLSLDAELPLARAAREGEPVWIESPVELAASFPGIEPADRVSIGQSFAALPLVLEARVLGALAFGFPAPRTLSEDDRSFMLALADQAANALDRARLYEAEHQARARAEQAEERSRSSAARIQLLADVSQAMLDAGLDLDAMLDTVAAQASQVIGDACAVRFFTSDRRAVITPAFHHPNPEARALAEPFLTGTPIAIEPHKVEAIERGESFIIPHLDKEAQYQATQPEVHAYVERIGMSSVLIAPLRLPRRILGYMALYRDDGGRPYQTDDRLLLQDLADRAAMALENARLYREAQHAIRARDDFLSIASHELKTPLTTLQLLLQGSLRLIDPALPGLDPRIPVRLRNAEGQVRRLSKLIDQLLDVSRLTSGRLKLEREPLNLGELVKDVLQRFEHELEHCGSALAVKLEGDLDGHWDRLRLDQVLTNLVSNAIKYGAGRPISVSASASPGEVHLRIADRGIGIAPENVGRLFERFERFVSVKNYGGFGLGLWITRQLVEQQGGRIHVDTELDRGTVFTVVLEKAP